MFLLCQELTQLVASLRQDNEELVTRHQLALTELKDQATAREKVSVCDIDRPMCFNDQQLQILNDSYVFSLFTCRKPTMHFFICLINDLKK